MALNMPVIVLSLAFYFLLQLSIIGFDFYIFDLSQHYPLTVHQALEMLP